MEHKEPIIYAQAELALDAERVLHKWSKTHDLIYITARRSHLTEVTTSWFTNQALPYTDIELVGKHDKIDAVKKNIVLMSFLKTNMIMLLQLLKNVPSQSFYLIRHTTECQFLLTLYELLTGVRLKNGLKNG